MKKTTKKLKFGLSRFLGFKKSKNLGKTMATRFCLCPIIRWEQNTGNWKSTWKRFGINPALYRIYRPSAVSGIVDCTW